jgi:hypothetical protein
VPEAGIQAKLACARLVVAVAGLANDCASLARMDEEEGREVPPQLQNGGKKISHEGGKKRGEVAAAPEEERSTGAGSPPGRSDVKEARVGRKRLSQRRNVRKEANY